jgi:predicted transcriptional regulator
MPDEIKRTPTINVVIQEFTVLERLDTIAEIYERDRNTLINQVLKHFVENMEQYKEIMK